MSDYLHPPVALGPGSVVWAYLRDSGGDAQEQSVSRQNLEIRDYCQRHELSLAHVFADIARSGGSVVGREQFTDLVDMSADANLRPAGLLVWNFARFARNLDDSGYYKAVLRKRGIVIHSLTDPIPDGIYGRVVETVIDIANEEKRRQTSRDVKSALAALARQGFSSGGYPPRGYTTEDVIVGRKRDGSPRKVSRWVPDPDLWDLVKLAWVMRAEGKSYGEIQEVTGRRIYKSKNCWPTFFENKTYLGIGKCGDLEVPNHHEAVVDLETWEKVQDIRRDHPLRESGNSLHPRRVGHPSLLSGLAVCIHCGAAMSHRSNSHSEDNNWPYYLCGKKERHGWKTCDGRMVNARLAEQTILDAVLERVLTPDYLDDLLNETRTRLNLLDIGLIDRQLEKIKRDLAENQGQINNLLDLVEVSGARAAVDRLKEREAERDGLLLDLRQWQSKKDAVGLKINPVALAFVFDYWREEIMTVRNVGNVQAMRRFLARFVLKVELGYNQTRIWYS